jgi:hypothetical protein
MHSEDHHARNNMRSNSVRQQSDKPTSSNGKQSDKRRVTTTCYSAGYTSTWPPNCCCKAYQATLIILMMIWAGDLFALTDDAFDLWSVFWVAHKDKGNVSERVTVVCASLNRRVITTQSTCVTCRQLVSHTFTASSIAALARPSHLEAFVLETLHLPPLPFRLKHMLCRSCLMSELVQTIRFSTPEIGSFCSHFVQLDYELKRLICLLHLFHHPSATLFVRFTLNMLVPATFWSHFSSPTSLSLSLSLSLSCTFFLDQTFVCVRTFANSIKCLWLWFFVSFTSGLPTAKLDYASLRFERRHDSPTVCDTFYHHLVRLAHCLLLVPLSLFLFFLQKSFRLFSSVKSLPPSFHMTLYETFLLPELIKQKRNDNFFSFAVRQKVV